ncbi:hypothetical protein ACFSVK_16240 [Azorhizophilus paspali]|uniref:hypothetical protein n=1 Tax=Azorhizophilus paspali TaxID=69963 RepID=UPI00363D8539
MNMHRFGILALTFSLLASGNAQADEMSGKSEERIADKSTGGMTGLMVGAIGGPIGALIGAGVGALVGSSSHASGADGEQAFQARGDGARVKTVRSPAAASRPAIRSGSTAIALLPNPPANPPPWPTTPVRAPCTEAASASYSPIHQRCSGCCQVRRAEPREHRGHQASPEGLPPLLRAVA